MGYDDWRRLCGRLPLFVPVILILGLYIGQIAGIDILLGLMLEDCMHECFVQYCEIYIYHLPDQIILIQAI